MLPQSQPLTQVISIAHQIADGTEPETVELRYAITAEGKMRTIACAVAPESRGMHGWLSLRRFDVRLMREGKTYTMMHNGRNDTGSRETGRFIDAVWEAILEKEAWVRTG